MTIRLRLKMSAFLSRRGRGGERLKRTSDNLGEASISMFGKILPLSFFPLHLVTRPCLLNRCSQVLPRQDNSTLKQQGAIQRNGAASSGATLYSCHSRAIRHNDQAAAFQSQRLQYPLPPGFGRNDAARESNDLMTGALRLIVPNPEIRARQM